MDVNLKECIAPNFHDVHRALKKGEMTEYWLRGGRGSTKSSFLSIQLILEIIRNPDANAVIFRRFENEIRDSVFGQMKWAVNKLQVDHLFKFNVSPYKITYIPTGQLIVFKGADNPQKIKSINLGTGYVAIGWWEETDQFNGMEEIRNIQQSLFRGTTKKQTAFYSYNPPKSARSWVNAETKITKPGRMVHYSDYRDVPRDWLGETFIANAEHLKKVNEEAYNHEYLGMETGTGLEVFNNVTLRKITDNEIENFETYSQGVDFGYGVDPLCFLQGSFSHKKKTLHLFFEISGLGIKNDKLISMLSDLQLADVTMGDSADPKTIDELRDLKMNVIGAKKPPGSRDYGFKYLQDLEEIIIDPIRCPLAASEFINYALRADRFGEVINKFPDKNDHSLDCSRYLLAQEILEFKLSKRQNKFKIRSIPTVNRW